MIYRIIFYGNRIYALFLPLIVCESMIFGALLLTDIVILAWYIKHESVIVTRQIIRFPKLVGYKLYCLKNVNSERVKLPTI